MSVKLSWVTSSVFFSFLSFLFSVFLFFFLEYSKVSNKFFLDLGTKQKVEALLVSSYVILVSWAKVKQSHDMGICPLYW